MLYITIWWEVWQQLHDINDKNVKAISTKSEKVSCKSPVKYKTKLYHENNLVCYSICPDKTCDDYFAETDRRTKKRITGHNYHDKNLHLTRHVRKMGYG